MSKTWILDTNIILDDPSNLVKLSENNKNKIVIPEVVLDELDAKKSGFEEINFNARQFARMLEDADIKEKRQKRGLTLITTTINSLNVDITIISKEKYECEETNIAVNILNDRKILEAGKDYFTTFTSEECVIMSLDIMCRTRALSLGGNTETLKGKDQAKELNFHRVVEVDDIESSFNGKNILEIDPDYTESYYSYTLVDKTTGRQKLGQVQNKHFYFIVEDNLTKQSVNPMNKEQKFFVNAMIEGYANIIAIDAKAGCVLPGTNINITVEDKILTPADACDVLDITEKEYKRLVVKGYAQADKLNVSTFRRFMVRSLELSKNQQLMMNNDSKYESKYLKLSYWLSTDLQVDECIKRTKLCRRYKEYFDYSIYREQLINKLFKEETLDTTCMKIQFKILSFKYTKLSELPGFSFTNRTVDFWTFRGYCTEEANEMVTLYQSKNSRIRLEKWNAHDFRRHSIRCVEYWEAKGYSTQDAREKVRKIQDNNSLKAYIARHGELEGTELFIDRNERWQNTLLSKPKEEISRINKSKGTKKGSDVPTEGCYTYKRFTMYPELATSAGTLYYIKLNIDDTIYYKIGITKNLTTRMRHFRNYNAEIVKTYESTLFDCYNKEQSILHKYKSVRVSVDGVSTKLFNTNIIKED